MDSSTPKIDLTRYEWEGAFAKYHPVHALEAARKIAEGFSLKAAAGAIQLPYSSLIHWIAHTPAFAKLIDIASAQRIYKLEHALLSTTDPTSAKTYLTALRKANPDAWEVAKPSPDQLASPTKIAIQIVNAPERSHPLVEINPLKERVLN